MKVKEILQENNGDWRSQSDNAKSMRELIKRMNNYFECRKSFHHENTLLGNELICRWIEILSGFGKTPIT